MILLRGGKEFAPRGVKEVAPLWAVITAKIEHHVEDTGQTITKTSWTINMTETSRRGEGQTIPKRSYDIETSRRGQ